MVKKFLWITIFGYAFLKEDINFIIYVVFILAVGIIILKERCLLKLGVSYYIMCCYENCFN